MQGDTRLASLTSLHGRTHPVVRIVGGISRFLLHRWSSRVDVHGVEHLADLVRDEKRSRGILTYANHISVADDPTMFGSLPQALSRQAKTTRWTLGASDIMFTNAVLTYFFKSGQVLATDRGRGVFQPALDRAVDILEQAGWMHLFPEGYVNLSRRARVRRFKWGIGRVLLEAETPIIVPCWISGFDQMMPDPRSAPKWLPRPGARLGVYFGKPINDLLDPFIVKMKHFAMEKGEGDEESGSVQASMLAALHDVKTLSPAYPDPSPTLFTEPTPIQNPEGGVGWPVPLKDSRSFKALRSGLDEPRARLARSLIAAELRAHLVKLGEQSGVAPDLAHRLMTGEENA